MCVLLETRHGDACPEPPIQPVHHPPCLPSFSTNRHPGQPRRSTRLYNSLQLPRVAQRVLDHQLAHLLLAASAGRRLVVVVGSLPAGSGGLGLLGEVDPAVLEGPAAGAGKVDDGALGVEEEERLCGRDGQGRVGALAAGCDLGADLGCEDLFLCALAGLTGEVNELPSCAGMQMFK